MQDSTQNAKKASPPAVAVRLKDDDHIFYAKDEQGVWRSIVLQYHVWVTGSGIHDAWYIVHARKSISAHQKALAIEYGILFPAQERGLRPSQEAEYNTAA